MLGKEWALECNFTSAFSKTKAIDCPKEKDVACCGLAGLVGWKEGGC